MIRRRAMSFLAILMSRVDNDRMTYARGDSAPSEARVGGGRRLRSGPDPVGSRAPSSSRPRIGPL